MRGVGLQSLLGSLPGPVVVLFSLLTQLGDVWFLTLLVTLTYWIGPRFTDAVDRRRAAVVVGVLLVGFAVVTVGKPLFALPRPLGAGRPPETDLVPVALWPLYEWFSTGSGFGFPSGHAIGSTAAYVGLAWALQTDHPRRRAAVAAVLVTVVSLSRLVLGLHYLVDVFTGVVLGLCALALAVRLGAPERVFGLATVVSAGGLALVGPVVDLVLVTGVAAGATVAWIALGDALARPPTREGALATAVLGVLGGAPILVIAGALHPDTVVAGLLGVAGGLLVAAIPLVGERVAKKAV